MILLICFLKVINIMNGTNKMKKKRKSLPEETIAERVKLRRQKKVMKICLTCHH